MIAFTRRFLCKMLTDTVPQHLLDVGSNNDRQDITTLVVNDKDQKTLQNYIKLNHRETGQKLDLTEKGIIISEKLADLAGISVGDEVTVQNSQDKDIKLKVAGISEMYMGYFIFMNESTYKDAFRKRGQPKCYEYLH